MDASLAPISPSPTNRDRASLDDIRAGVLAGEWTLVDIAWLESRLTIVLRRRRGAAGRAPSRRELEVLRLVARGHADKWIAYELDVSRTTVATHLANALQKIGVEHRTHLPLLRFLFDWEADEGPRTMRIRERAEEYVSLIFGRSTGSLLDRLTPAEASVAVMALEGCTNREIAADRAVSERTVANQLQEVYRKCGVNSRAELAAAIAD